MIDDNLSYLALQTNQRQRLETLIPLDMPMSIYLDPSSYCNFKCVFCPHSFSDFRKYCGKPQHMDTELFEKIIMEVEGWGKLKVLRLYYLGEPFLNPRLIQMLNLLTAHDVCDRIEITTNGTMLNEKTIKDLMWVIERLSIPIYIRISIYSVIQDKHNYLTQSKVPIDKIFSNVANLRKKRDSMGLPNLFIYAKMIDSLCEENDLFISKYSEIVDELCIEEAMNWSGFDDRNLIGNLYGSNGNDYPLFKKERKVCPYPFYSLAIHSNGDVVCCCVDWSRGTLIGNVCEQSLRQIWNGELLQSMRQLQLQGNRYMNKACQNCTFLFNCPKEDDLDNLVITKDER